MADRAQLSVVVTRAVHQADELCRLIEKASAEAIRFPVTKIEPVDDDDPRPIQLIVVFFRFSF